MIKFLHTRLRVSDLDRSIHFYSKFLGFQVLRRTDKSPSGNHIVLLELPGNAHQLELTWSESYKLNVPKDLIHLAIGVPDLIDFCDRLENAGIEVWPDAWRKTFLSGKKMAFIDDPDGYEIELLEEYPNTVIFGK
ncbi:VOC family protein [Nitrospira defluvii]|nr:VOC family protein [Nitrospira defluvii]